MRALPTGTVTFLFSDIEGSTQLLQRLGDDYARMLGEHQAMLRTAWAAHGGAEVDTAGDGFFVAFPSAPAAVAAAAQATRALAAHAWPEVGALRVRIGLHTGTPLLTGERYVGLDVHRAARIAGAGHGGQILLSQTTRDLAEHDLPDGATLRDLGAHRLKDLQHAERLYQLALSDLPSEFPPLRTLDRRAHNLTIQPTALVGREVPLAALCTLLRREVVRLVTLSGPGGIGKTRLAVQVAAELLDEFPDGVWFVRLSRLSDPALVLSTVAETLGLREQGRQPIAETLRAYLRDRHLLLVLDNFEQVVGAAPGVAELLETAPSLKALVTSRIPLHLRGEREYPLGPLALPNDPRHLPAPERLSQYAAMALFVERARDAHPDFTVTAANAATITEICARLDGLPLAIELAAARVKLLPPAALLARLSSRLKLLTGGARDLEERQRTMRATIAWSEGLLSPQERILLRRLAVFVGGCTLEAAEAVCVAPSGAKPLKIDLLDGLGRLVDQSLVQQREDDSESRLGMLHVIQEFALERLEASREIEALRHAHAEQMLALAAVAPVGMRAGSDARWLAKVEREHDNLRAALGWALGRGDVDLSLRLGVGFAPFWWARGYYGEGRRWLAQVLAVEQGPVEVLYPDAARAALHAWALWWLGKLAWNQLDITSAREWATKCLDAARACGDPVLTAVALAIAGSVELDPPLRDRRRGEELLVEAVALASHSNDDEALVRVLGDKFNAFVDSARELAEAQALAKELLDAARRLDTLTRRNVEAHVSSRFADVAQRQGDVSSAAFHAEFTLRTVRETGFLVSAADCLRVLAWVADQMGEGERAARLLGASATEAERQAILGYGERIEREAALASLRAALGEDAWTAAYAAGRALSLEEAIDEALETEQEQMHSSGTYTATAGP
jgi:predicted ATPase/class 3 adenylate cyclase